MLGELARDRDKKEGEKTWMIERACCLIPN